MSPTSATSSTGTSATDPVCGMQVNPATAPAQSVYQGQSFYFCSVECKREFDANPKKYVKTS